MSDTVLTDEELTLFTVFKTRASKVVKNQIIKTSNPAVNNAGFY